MNYVIDANIYVSDSVATDVHHTDSQAFLNALRGRPERIYCPSLVLVEVAAAITRPTGNVVLAQSAVRVIVRSPGMRLVGLTIRRARQAVQLATTHRLRGADTVYLAVAAEFGATLITWDAELLTRGAGVVTTMTPADWLANPPPI